MLDSAHIGEALPVDSTHTVQIPASLDEAISNLNGLEALLTAKQWERAAIVYAFTRDVSSSGQRNDLTDTDKLSDAEFAALGIAGLQGRTNVGEYRRAWRAAIEAGQAKPVQPGDRVELPDLPWKDFFGHVSEEADERAVRRVIADPDRFREALRDRPEVAATLAQRVTELPAVRTAVEHRLAEPITEREVQVRPEPQRAYGDDLIRGINLLIPVVRAVQRGEWKPSPAEAMLLHSLGLLLDQAASPEGEPQDGLFTQIERYLKEGVM
jgi:hypothetical protein